MNKSFFAAVAATALLAASAASAAVVGDFQLNGSLANGAGGGAILSDNTMGGLGPSGIDFGANQGPTVTGLGTLAEYTIETNFSLDSVSSYRKVVDFFDRVSDGGFYVLNGRLNFYPFATGPDEFVGGQAVTAVLTRDASKLVTAYLNGVSQFSFVDTTDQALINGALHFFRDDFATGQGEASSGFVNYIRISDTAGAPTVVPEPAAWALMIMGFGAVGAVVRRRRVFAAA